MGTPLPTAEMTVAEFVRWSGRPDNDGRSFELDRGRVVEVPPPQKPHGLVAWLVIRVLTAYLAPRTGFLRTHDTGLVVGTDPDTLRGPDIMLFLRPITDADFEPGYVEEVPALIVEILSPSDGHSRTVRRTREYLDRGVPLVWVVEPTNRTVTVYRPDEWPRVLDEADDLTGNGVLPDFRCRVAELFGLPPGAP